MTDALAQTVEVRGMIRVLVTERRTLTHGTMRRSASFELQVFP